MKTSKNCREKQHEKMSKDFYAHADRESYYNSYEYLHNVTRTDKFFPIVSRLAGKQSLIIDMGCGTGLWTKLLSKLGKVIGIDFSADRIAISRERNPGFEYRKADLKKIKSMFKDNSVSMFFSSCSLYCLTAESQRNLFKDCLSLLSPGGKLIFIEPNGTNVFREKSAIKYPFEKNKTQRLLRELGYVNVKARRYNFIPRSAIRSRSLVYHGMLPVEKLLETLQIPWSGSLLVYAEKPKK